MAPPRSSGRPLPQELICLRAIRDVNVPKFLQEDLKLFSGIVSDLFPTIKEEETDYGILDQAIRKACEKSNLKDVEGELQPQESCRPLALQSEQVLAPAILDAQGWRQGQGNAVSESLTANQRDSGLSLLVLSR